jgi:hypothetical protein
MTTSPTAAPGRFPGRLYLALGLGLAALGVLGYGAQLWAQHLKAPKYLPYSATLGAVLVVAALWQARSVWRVLALLLLLLLAGAEWTFVLGSRLPAYTGPVEVGRPFPAFATARSDGTPFTPRDLLGDRNHVLVFFRGRW